MERAGSLISWMVESIASLPASLFDPKYRGPIYAICILVVLYSIVSSINRLNRTIASTSSELSAIRSTLKRIEGALDRQEAKLSPSKKEENAVRDLLFRLENDPPERDR